MFITKYEASALQPKAKNIRLVKPPGAGKGVKFTSAEYNAQYNYVDVRKHHGGKDGLLYVRGTIALKKAGKGQLKFGADGPVKVWLNGKAVACEPGASNPITPTRYAVEANWKKGNNTVLFALDTNKARAWGVTAVVVES